MNICRLRLVAAISIAVFAALVLTTRQTWADTSNPSSKLDKLVEQLQDHYNKTTSFTAKFNEQIIPVGGLKRARQGIVYYQRPGRMRWEFVTPVKELIVSDGTTVYDYQPDMDQVVEVPLKQAFRSSAATAFLLGMGNLKRDFTVSSSSGGKAPSGDKASDGLIHLTLKPNDGGNRIDLGLDPKTYNIETLKLTDQLGNVTLLNFSDIQTDVKLDSKLFAFKVPQGADIVRQPSAP